MDCPRFRHTRINEEQNELGIEELVDIIKNQVGTVVIGLPKNMNNSIDFEERLRYNTKRNFKKPCLHRNYNVG